MKITSQLSIASIALLGLIASGCSQQQVASPSQQVASPSQQSPSQQVASPSQQSPSQQVASPSQQSPSQQSPSQQVVEEEKVVVEQKPVVVPNPPVKRPPVKRPTKRPMPRPSGNCHTHPPVPGCTDSIRHCHPSAQSRHTHKYSCKGGKRKVTVPACRPCAKAPARKAVRRPAPVQRSGAHSHPAIPGCTDSIRHYHPSNNARHSHKYSCKKGAARRPVAPRRPQSGGHTHPAIPGCTDSIRHYHPSKNARHSHKYSCRKGAARRPAPRRSGGKWAHTHPAIPGCTDSISHVHKYTNRNHSHKYQCRKQVRRAAPSRKAMAPKGSATVDVFALQRKLKAKGYYRGPIDGVVGSGTRSALQQYMQNRN